MTKVVLDHYDFNQKELRQPVLELRTSDPGSPVNGQVWYRTDLNEFRIRRNGATVTVLIANIGQIVNADIAAGAAIALSKLATDPLARANHTGAQLAATISDLATVVQAYRLDQFAAPTSALNLNNQRITSLASPSVGTDAANKNYVDNTINALKWSSARAASTGNVPLTGTPFIVDGITIATGERVLLKNQSTPAQNGIYINDGTSTLARAPDMDTAAEVDGKVVVIEDGTQAGTAWITTSEVTTLNTDTITFTQFGGGTTYTAGNGLALSGATLDVNVDNVGIEIATDILQLKDSGVLRAKLEASLQAMTSVEHPPVRVATAGAETDINLASAAASYDGVALTAGDRVLVKGQVASPTQNGIYIWNGAGSAMTRASDFPVGWQFSANRDYVYVREGTENARKLFTPGASGTVNTNTQSWAERFDRVKSYVNTGLGAITANSTFTVTHNLNTLNIASCQLRRVSDGALVDVGFIAATVNTITFTLPDSYAANIFAITITAV